MLLLGLVDLLEVGGSTLVGMGDSVGMAILLGGVTLLLGGVAILLAGVWASWPGWRSCCSARRRCWAAWLSWAIGPGMGPMSDGLAGG